jgi:hypothetical protein
MEINSIGYEYRPLSLCNQHTKEPVKWSFSHRGCMEVWPTGRNEFKSINCVWSKKLLFISMLEQLPDARLGH